MKKIDFPAKKSLSYTELRNCPLCNSSQSKSILRFDSFQFLTDSHEHSKTVDIDIHICDQCTTFFNQSTRMRGLKIFLQKWVIHMECLKDAQRAN